MLQSLLLPMLSGVAAGLAAALIFILLYTRNQRRSATGILSLARAEIDRLRGEGQREAESARSDLLLSGKMEALRAAGIAVAETPATMADTLIAQMKGRK